jgi:hypothetical protein
MRYVGVGALLLCLLPFSGCLVIMNMGDPFVDTETPEELDDGVPIGTSRIFVTSTTQNGSMGGKAGANAICAARATAANLTRTYQALLADQTTTMQSGFSAQMSKPVFKVDSDGDYVLVAKTLSAMFAGSGTTALLAAPNSTEFGEDLKATVWTGSNSASTGGVYTGNNCTSWSTTGAASSYGWSGSTSSTAIYTSLNTCSNLFAIYCLSND